MSDLQERMLLSMWTFCRAPVTAERLWALFLKTPDPFFGGLSARSSLQSTFRLTCHVGLDMGLFLISQIPWGSNAYEFDTLRCLRPLQICFPGYRMPELLQVQQRSIPEHTIKAEPLFSVEFSTKFIVQFCPFLLASRMPSCIVQILAKCRPEGDDERLFSIFLGTFIGPMFARCSSRIEDLQVLLTVPFRGFRTITDSSFRL